MKKYLVIILIIALAILLSVVGFIIYQSRTIKKTTVEINNFKFLATIANTEQSRGQGLSGKDSMPNGEAMLFLFPDQQIRIFWMKNMKFDLDILFIHDHKIIDIITLQKPSGSKIPSYTSKSAADKVLEINASLTQKLNIKIGDSIEINP
jgi:hypothetical protein